MLSGLQGYGIALQREATAWADVECPQAPPARRSGRAPRSLPDVEPHIRGGARLHHFFAFQGPCERFQCT